MAQNGWFYKQVIRCKPPGQTYHNIRVIAKSKKINKKLWLDICTADASEPIINCFGNSNIMRNDEILLITKMNAVMHLNLFKFTCYKTPRVLS